MSAQGEQGHSMTDEGPEKIAQEPLVRRVVALFKNSSIAALLGIMTVIMATSLNVATRDEPQRVILDKVTYTKIFEKLDDSRARLDRILKEDASKVPPQVLIDLATVRANLQDIEHSMIGERLVPVPTLFDKMKDFIFSPAHSAETATTQVSDSFSSASYIRPGILLFMLLSITVFFIACIVTYFRTTDAERLKFAMNSIQTILGFYIGVFTGLLGLQS
jgi:hypothetical protein